MMLMEKGKAIANIEEVVDCVESGHFVSDL